MLQPGDLPSTSGAGSGPQQQGSPPDPFRPMSARNEEAVVAALRGVIEEKLLQFPRSLARGGAVPLPMP